MGHLRATEMAASAGDGTLSFGDALHYHLTANHYPPVSAVFIPAASEAIRKANLALETEDPAVENGLWSYEITLPNGVVKSVAEIIEELHLDAFLEGPEDHVDEDEARIARLLVLPYIHLTAQERGEILSWLNDLPEDRQKPAIKHLVEKYGLEGVE